METDQQPAFAPPEIAGKRPRGKRPVDLVHLARQTGGDRALEEEVLRLFLRQASMIGRAMRQHADIEIRKRSAHTLKGAARAVGASEVAARAGALEAAPGESQCMRALLREIDTTCDFINSILR